MRQWLTEAVVAERVRVSATLAEAGYVVCRVDVRGTGSSEGIATDEAISARAVFNDDRCFQNHAQSVGHNASNHVRRAARRKRHDHRNRPRRIGLRPRDPRHSRQHGSARGQMQKLSAEKFHIALS